MKQAVKKKDIGQKMSISAFKEKIGMTISDKNPDLSKSNADKKMEWLVMPPAYEEALKIPGVPQGYVTTICGHSNTGKSTLVNCAIAAAQKQGILPVIYDTENNFDFSYAIDCGMKAEPVYGDVEVEVVDQETGEVTYVTENRIINYTGDFLYFNQPLLAEMYGDMDYSSGKQVKTKRKQAVLEDIAYSINTILDAQEEGDIQQGILFIWDSVGSIISYKSYASKTGNNMFDAGAISNAFNNILNSRIPASRKMSSQYTNSMILINKVWLDNMTNPVGPPSIELKGGRSIFYSSRLIMIVGGQLKSSVKKLTAVAKGAQYNYGIETKIKVLKNQLPTPYNITYEGVMCCVSHGIISPTELDSYKKEHMSSILKQIQNLRDENNSSQENITEKDIQFTEEDSVE
jgi:hypothetical protein